MRTFIHRTRICAVASLTTFLSAILISAAAADTLAVTSINPSPTAPSDGTLVTWSAAASGDGTVLYRFWLYNETTLEWTVLRDYAPSPSVTWTATPGTYHAQVWAKESSSPAMLDAWQNSATIAVAASSPAHLSSFNVSRTATNVGAPVVFTAAASGGAAAEYRFYLYDVSRATWTMLRDYASGPSVSWTPSQAGEFYSQVWVRATGSSSAWEDWRNSSVVTVAGAASTPVALTGVATSRTSATTPTPVVFTASATGGTGAYEFRFDLYDAGRGTWSLLQAYATNASVTWTPADAGSYWVQVWVRAAGASNAWDDWRNSPVVSVTVPTVTPVTLTGLTTSRTFATTQTPIVFSAAAKGGTGTYEYCFELYDADHASWTTLQTYATTAAVTWTPDAAGTYWVQVWVRAIGSSSEWDDWRNSEVVTATAANPWAVVRTLTGNNIVSWSAVPGADGYLVLESTERAELVGSPSTTGAASATASPYTSTTAAGATPHYFRIFPVVQGVTGVGGPIAASTSVTPHSIPVPSPLVNGPLGEDYSGEVTPALWDINGDGCLDLIGRMGACDGTFTATPLDPSGPGLLFASGRANRDSRFADLTGDGIVDIFTNVYSPATDTASRAILLVGQPDGTFLPDPGVAALEIGGYGETVVAADFDNDGDVDLYLPHYFAMSDGGHSWLLVNDGHGVFHDVSFSAGVSSTAPFNPEGAQALDYNQDGWVDLLVATHLYINNGDLTFTDQASSVGLPAAFDEGLMLFDGDLDGDLDLVHHDGAVTKLYRNVGGHYDSGTALTGAYGQNYGFGLNVCDINGDGYQDIVVAQNNLAGTFGTARLLLNGGGEFAQSELTVLPETTYADLIACADLDSNGLPDLMVRSVTGTGSFQSLMNNGSSHETLTLRVLGNNGERNQQGRAVRVRPVSGSGQTILRFVESGSAYMAQNGYDQLIGIPWAGALEVSVLFGGGWVTTTAQAGDALTFYADGTIAAGLH